MRSDFAGMLILAAACAAVAASGVTAACAKSRPAPMVPCIVDVAEKTCGQTRTIRTGCALRVTVTPYVSSGYLWRIEHASEELFVSKELDRRGPEPTEVPGRRQQVFEFVARRAGQGTIVLRHERPFAPDDKPELCRLPITIVP